MSEDYDRKSKIAFGLALVCLLFVGETFNADRLMPNPASPYVWSFLGLAALGLIGYGLHCRRKARQK